MPHVIVKLLVGRSEQQKSSIAEAITLAIMAHANAAASSVSVSIVDIQPDRWTADVYGPDIATNWDRLYKKPGYGPNSGQ